MLPIQRSSRRRLVILTDAASTSIIAVIFISAKEDYYVSLIFVSMFLLASNITRKVMDKFSKITERAALFPSKKQ